MYGNKPEDNRKSNRHCSGIVKEQRVDGSSALTLLCTRAKFRGSPKALITKDKTETSYPASLMIEGIVISLKILVIGMGDRGSKSITSVRSEPSVIVKEQRVDGSSVLYKLRDKFVVRLSGHMLLNILAGFTYNIMTSGFIFFFLGLIPLAFIIAFSGLELGIAFIQAQVFVVLTSSYIKDALDLH
ncbi:hypothetical protein HYFRA_00013644 [Hymenoscyphus fraxineus]|uniref:ATP synthase subunit a n=1 Tax=Hymenoscyphus fraxineus TaxID=746836 RepID=A0A9N9LB61_9HELO|nr:hypothetical protein HYFRA_00013644 [Hymenoscyphus fraxineus]